MSHPSKIEIRTAWILSFSSVLLKSSHNVWQNTPFCSPVRSFWESTLYLCTASPRHQLVVYVWYLVWGTSGVLGCFISLDASYRKVGIIYFLEAGSRCICLSHIITCGPSKRVSRYLVWTSCHWKLSNRHNFKLFMMNSTWRCEILRWSTGGLFKYIKILYACHFKPSHFIEAIFVLIINSPRKS